MVKRIADWISRFFGLFMLGGLVLGLCWPVYSIYLMQWLEVALMFILFLVFLKIDLLDLIRSISRFRLLAFLSLMYLLVIPALVYGLIQYFDPGLAVALLLLLAMPPGTASPALADLMKGNVSLSMSLTIVGSLLAPLTVPLLFYVLVETQLQLDTFSIFRKIALLVFLPMGLSQLVKSLWPGLVAGAQAYFSAVNVLVFFVFVYATIGAQRDLLLQDPWEVLLQLLIIYVLFVFLHFSGYLMGAGHSRADRVSIVIGHAYMNNGMAIVLAAAFFEPAVLLLMVLSEFPWNTLPALMGWWMRRRDRDPSACP